MAKRGILSVFLILLTSCSSIKIPLSISTKVFTPSPTPQIVSPTPPFAPSATPTGTASLSPTLSATSTIPTLTVQPPPTPAPLLQVGIVGCNTSLDIAHGMGEVTNAYPLIRNNTESDLMDVCATLSASDEARTHPDKMVCISSLPPRHQVTLKLTVDTGFEKDTSIKVEVTADGGYSGTDTRPSCRDLGLPGWVPSKVGVIEPIP
jgi:hypothetical protein